MNRITRTLFTLLLVGSSAGLPLKAMDQQIIPTKEMSKKMLMAGFKELPHELKLYIIYLLFESTLGYSISPFKTVALPSYAYTLACGFKETLLAAPICKPTAYVWSLETENPPATFTGDNEPIHSLAYSPDGKMVVSGSLMGTLCLWDTETHELITTFKEPSGPIYAVAFSPDGETIVSGLHNGIVRVWTIKTGESIHFKGHIKAIVGVAFSPQGEIILTGSEDNKARLWNSKTGERVLTLKGHTDEIACVAFSPTGEKVLTGSEDKTARVWSSKTGELLLTLKEHDCTVSAVAWTPDGKTILTGSNDKKACVWSATTGKMLTSLPSQAFTSEPIAWSPTGKFFLTVSFSENTAYLWKLLKGFEGLVTEEQKNACFKQFMALYPLLQKKSSKTKDKALIRRIKKE